MTFVGFLFTVANFVMLSWYDWGFWASSTGVENNVPIPNWFWAVAAFNIFLAYTLGKLQINFIKQIKKKRFVQQMVLTVNKQEELV